MEINQHKQSILIQYTTDQGEGFDRSLINFPARDVYDFKRRGLTA